jgi:Nucleotidyl transferase AbiEii toxin, Type IV TA system
MLFNELKPGGPRLLFKGGTSLSKGYGLIERFSEDIDISVFRADIGQAAPVEELEALSGKRRAARLAAIRRACQEYIHGPMLEQCWSSFQHFLSARSKRQIWEPSGRVWNRIPTILTVRACCSGIPPRPRREIRTSVEPSRSSRARNRRSTRTLP